MAPTSRQRGRPRKGLTRMDAALDAMRSYGFSDGLIVSTAKGLLKVYGEEGWPFIEETSYKVLLEAMLEKAEENEDQEKSNAFQDIKGQENNVRMLAGDNAEISAAGTSSGAPISTCQCTEAIAVASQTNEALHAVSQAGNILDTTLSSKESDGGASFPAPEGEGCRWKDIKLDGEGSIWKDIKMNQHCMEKQINDEMVLTIVKSDGVEEVGSTGLSTPQSLNHLPPRSRRPCHGWISSDDDEEDDLVELTAAPLPGETAKFHCATDRVRNR